MDDEAWLKELLHEPPLADDGFAERTVVRMRRQERRRRLEAWLPAVVAACAAAVFGWWLPVPAGPPVLDGLAGAQGFLGLLVGCGICGALWLDTESMDPWV